MADDEAGDVARDRAGEWATVAEAARRLGLTPKAVRNRIARGQIEWRARGNEGREVFLPAGAEAGDDDPAGPGTVALLRELAEARERAARAEGELVGLRAALREAGARAGAAEAEASRMAALLADALRPWWRRWLAG